MPRLTRKADLLARFEEAVRASGWSVLYLSRNEHPARYRVYRGELSFTVKVYIWNISHGGRGRAASEYRIQITGVDEFRPDADAQNLILGWWEDVGAFAGWDIRQHLGALGASPSMQVSEEALRGALLTGFAPYANQRDETAIAFRPDFIGTYISYLEALHDSGTVPAEANLLARLSADPDEVEEAEIEEIEAGRRYAVLATRRALRALDFSARVLNAYGHRCAMCGVQLRLLDGAHILPVVHPDSTDQTSNGVALCALHHRAYDRGLVTFDVEFAIHLNTRRVADLRVADRAGGIGPFRAALRPVLITPPDRRDRPHSRYIRRANALRGWDV